MSNVFHVPGLVVDALPPPTCFGTLVHLPPPLLSGFHSKSHSTHCAASCNSCGKLWNNGARRGGFSGVAGAATTGIGSTSGTGYTAPTPLLLRSWCLIA